MPKIKLLISILFILLLVYTQISWGQTTLSSWGFEGVTTTNTGATPTISVGTAAADAGLLTAGSAFSGLHASASTVWSNTAGNGSAKSVSSNTWGIGDYYQFLFSTTGATGITITWDQNGSNTGPKDFKVQYSTNGTTFTDAAGTNSVVSLTNDAWSSSSPKSASTRTLDLSSVSSLDNQSNVYIRIVMTTTNPINGTFGTGGTDRIDNFIVKANTILPVELSSFTGNSNGRNIQLAWETKTEVNFSKFEIERYSSDLNRWTTVCTLKAGGTTNSPRQYSYTDKNLQAGKYMLRLKMIDNDGTFRYSDVIETEVNLPSTYQLGQNYPNPFNPSTKISYSLPSDSKVTLDVFNIAGIKVGQLVNKDQSAGFYSVEFNSSTLGRDLSSGVYFYRIHAVDNLTGRDFSSVKKMIMLK